jgi:phytoene dehydrogenase-like protein
VVERYDACVIGAGADGLAAAIMLARADLKTILLERSERLGGRMQTREFHPGFRASPFVDDIAPIPAEIFWSFDLARRGATLFSPQNSVALWPDAHHVVRLSAQSVLSEATGASREAMERVAEQARSVPARASFFARPQPPEPWPGEAWTGRSLTDLLAERGGEPAAAAHLMAMALSGRAADPHLAGTALHLLAPPGGSGMPLGGLGALAEALMSAVKAEGVEVMSGLDVTDIRQSKGRVTGVCLADGREIAARAVVSTLDLKRSALTFFKWNELPPTMAKRASGFRMAGGTARLLLALERLPELPLPKFAFAPLHLTPDPSAQAQAYAAWRNGTIAERPPITLRLVSASDSSAAPLGKAVMAATLGCVPFRLFDGAWTKEKRDQLQARALARIEEVLPGTQSRLLHAEIIVPPDFEDALGLTEGDLWGGEIASDQMLDLRPGLDAASPRTPMDGLYLAGPSSAAGPLASCVAGVAAAGALITDAKAGRLK